MWYILWNDLLTLNTLNSPMHRRIRYMELIFYTYCKHIPISHYLFLTVIWHCEYNLSIAWNGVMHLARVPLWQTKIHLFLFQIKETSHDFNCICALLIYVITWMSAVKTFQRGLHKEIICWCFLTFELVSNSCIDTSCTRNKYLSLVFWIEIDKIFTCHEAWFHTKSSCQTCFFITCEHTFYRTMFYIIAIKNSQFNRTTDTIVCTKCSSFRTQPLAIDVGLDSICVEIKVYIHQLITYHVHVTL